MNGIDKYYLDAVQQGDTATVETLVKGAAVANGYIFFPVYHGTSAKFTVFNPKKTAQGILWFSEDKEKILGGESGAQGISIVMPVCLKIKRIAGWTAYNNLLLEQLRREFDGAKLDDDYFVFDSNQVKSFELVTYFQRKIIPLSQRFDVSKNDIRF